MVRWAKRLLLGLAIAGFALAAGLLIFAYPKYREYKRTTDAFDLAELDKIPAISEVFDYAGMRYSRLAGEARYVVPLSQISPFFIKALLAREDSRFYQHRGVDFQGIARASNRNLNAWDVK